MIKRGAIKIWQFLITPHKIRKVKSAASFHKKCEYHQQAIEHLFRKGVFDDWSGCVEIHRGPGQLLSDSQIYRRQRM